mmetsp:Transcript_12729/g.29279  ORF Transcript_12729/g.29279 Transcript_12729/m.29279 type:complete len:200 (+) Transcript_12729:382-981(+)
MLADWIVLLRRLGWRRKLDTVVLDKGFPKLAVPKVAVPDPLAGLLDPLRHMLVECHVSFAVRQHFALVHVSRSCRFEVKPSFWLVFNIACVVDRAKVSCPNLVPLVVGGDLDCICSVGLPEIVLVTRGPCACRYVHHQTEQALGCSRVLHTEFLADWRHDSQYESCRHTECVRKLDFEMTPRARANRRRLGLAKLQCYR